MLQLDEVKIIILAEYEQDPQPQNLCPSLHIYALNNSKIPRKCPNIHRLGPCSQKVRYLLKEYHAYIPPHTWRWRTDIKKSARTPFRKLQNPRTSVTWSSPQVRSKLGRSASYNELNNDRHRDYYRAKAGSTGERLPLPHGGRARIRSPLIPTMLKDRYPKEPVPGPSTGNYRYSKHGGSIWSSPQVRSKLVRSSNPNEVKNVNAPKIL